MGIIRVTPTENGVQISNEDFDKLVDENENFRRGLGSVIQSRTIHGAKNVAASVLAGLAPGENVGATEEQASEE